METRKDRHIGWEKVDRCHERDTFEKVAGLDAICFNDKAYERLTADTHIYGDIFALRRYAIYGQVWLLPDEDRGAPRLPQHGYRILNAILADLSNRPECIRVSDPDIPGSHTALVIAALIGRNRTLPFRQETCYRRSGFATFHTATPLTSLSLRSRLWGLCMWQSVFSAWGHDNGDGLPLAMRLSVVLKMEACVRKKEKALR